MAEALITNGTSTTPLDGNVVLDLLNHINEINDSLFSKEIECLEAKHQDSTSLTTDVCPVDWDSLLCWPKAPAGTHVKLPCFDQLYGIRYDSSQNASRWCWPNGTWDNRTDYSHCHELKLPVVESSVEITTTLYFVGYVLSLSTLIVAVAIFLYYKELRCLRNNIHTNLMFTYILADLTWILTTVMQVSMQSDIPSCIIFISLLNYFHLTNFFWMFVEGLYLYLLVVKTFTGDNIKLRLCLVIGWGAPIFVIAVWCIAKSTVVNTESSNQNVALYRHCPWMVYHPYDWFYQAPAITVLGINVIFLFMIMWVLITKLRSANNVETQQYRKASKALLVLIPLLGVTYVLVIAGPTEGEVANIFSYARAILLSSQGLSVALFYCFLNSEVQNTVRHHFSRWSAARNLGMDRKYYNNWSPRSRTESIRLYCQPSVPYKKRESTASETTTTTVVGMNSTTTFLDRSRATISEELNE
ncbi:diuretic hormone receptor [Microplitis demolitor]|uniref:diuretic hormone receptor n=1 Tax=Microplitis demolitor TaxID=69319 RepID=UPI0004CD7E59|nr:diuretic hormone receptor [Microplitis demolitor]XP_014296612.1 diuretic hormone receptor [Microplitis demolitor]